MICTLILHCFICLGIFSLFLKFVCGYFFFVFKVCVWVFCLFVVVFGGRGDAEQESIEMKRVNDVSQDANTWTRLNFVDLM